jgi:hypothetical protein
MTRGDIYQYGGDNPKVKLIHEEIQSRRKEIEK